MITGSFYDEIHLIVCPFIMGGNDSITPVEKSSFWPAEEIPRCKLVDVKRMGDYLYIVYVPKNKL
jgi:riboflavin biosynthesis pyrimidine reductase